MIPINFSRFRYYAMQGDTLLYKTFLHHELPVLVVYEKEIETYFNNFSDSIQQFKLQRCPKLGGDPDDEDDEKDPDIGMYKGSFRWVLGQNQRLVLSVA